MSGYFLMIEGNQEGPFSLEQVKDMYRDRKIDTYTPLSNTVDGSWATLGDLLRSVFSEDAGKEIEPKMVESVSRERGALQNIRANSCYRGLREAVKGMVITGVIAFLAVAVLFAGMGRLDTALECGIAIIMILIANQILTIGIDMADVLISNRVEYDRKTELDIFQSLKK